MCNMLESRIFTRSKVFVVQPRCGKFSGCKANTKVRQFDRVHQLFSFLRLEVFEEEDDQRDDSKHDDGRCEDGKAVEHLVLAQRVGVHVERPEGWQLDVPVFLRENGDGDDDRGVEEEPHDVLEPHVRLELHISQSGHPKNVVP